MRGVIAAAAVLVLLACAIGYGQTSFTGVLGQWLIPANAADLKNPQPSMPGQLVKGRSVYASQCERCHGPAGTGDGADGDPTDPTSDLTDSFRTSINPDGVVFYKILNGRGPRMPAFKGDLSTDQIWTVVAYVQTLRKKE